MEDSRNEMDKKAVKLPQQPEKSHPSWLVDDRFLIAPTHKHGKPIRDTVINLTSDKKHCRKNSSTTLLFFLPSVLIRPLQTYSFSQTPSQDKSKSKRIVRGCKNNTN